MSLPLEPAPQSEGFRQRYPRDGLVIAGNLNLGHRQCASGQPLINQGQFLQGRGARSLRCGGCGQEAGPRRWLIGPRGRCGIGGIASHPGQQFSF